LAFPVSAEWLVDLPPLPPRFRRFHPSDVHLTLLFLGGCGESAARAALLAVGDALKANPVSPVTITLGNIVPMGPKHEHTALSAVLDAGQEKVAQLMLQLRDAPADAAGIRRDKRAPLPHVTLGRPQRRATAEDRVAGLSWADSVILPKNAHTLDRIALYTWNKERRDALFQVVDSVGLSGVDANADARSLNASLGAR
jgi:2'-5' RNA ligase